MIQPNELRIGNWVIGASRGLPIQVTGVILSQFHKMNVHPVELTPDILEAIGFKNGIKTIQTSFLETELYVDLMERDAGFNKHGLWFPCKYLHQLQNLYWCLCGEELHIDVTKLNKEK